MSRVWSPSAIDSYDTCPRQWMLRYENANPARRAEYSIQPPPHVRMGTAAHAGLETAYRAAKAAGVWLPGKFMSLYADEAIERVRDVWGELGLIEEESAVVEDEVAAVLARLPLPHPDNILGVELTMPSIVHGLPMTNIIDVGLRTGADSLHIRDWKRRSLRTLPKSRELPDDRKMCSYVCAAAQRFPWARRITVGLYSLVANREVMAEVPLAKAEYVMAGVVETAYRAEDDREYPPTPDGRNCSSCRVRAACPVWTMWPPSPGEAHARTSV